VRGIGRFAFFEFPAQVTLPPDGALVLIGESAFQNSAIYEITIPRSVTAIGASAFRGSRLASLNFPTGALLERIEPFAFADTDLRELTIPARVTSFAGSAVDQLDRIAVADGGHFTVAGSLLLSKDKTVLVKGFGSSSELAVPPGIRIIASYAFSGLRTLTRVVLPQDLVRIERGTFVDTAIRVLELPAGVTVDPVAFERIQAVIWTPQNAVLREAIGYEGPARALLFTGDHQVLIRCFARARVVIVPAAVREIGRSSFAGVETVRLVECETGSRLAVVREEAFARSGLLTLRLPRGVERIEPGAVPLEVSVELEAGLVTPALEEAFVRWLAIRRTGADAGFPAE
jgi:hypothetical protein